MYDYKVYKKSQPSSFLIDVDVQNVNKYVMGKIIYNNSDFDLLGFICRKRRLLGECGIVKIVWLQVTVFQITSLTKNLFIIGCEQEV